MPFLKYVLSYVTFISSVRCVTWNVGDEAPPQSDFRQLLGLTADKPPDVIGVAYDLSPCYFHCFMSRLQEVVNDDAWRKALIAHVHPSGYVLVSLMIYSTHLTYLSTR